MSSQNRNKRRPGPITISSPIPRSPDGLLMTPPISKSTYPSSSTSSPRTPIRQNGRNPRGGKNGQRVYDEYDLSPTHAYLEQFDSYPSSPDPTHMPISPTRSPFDSPALSANEKDPLGGPSTFGQNQFSSNHYLAPTLHPYGERNKLSPAEKNYKKPTRSCIPTNPTKRKLLFFGVPLALVVVAGIVIGVIVATQHKTSTNNGSGSSSGSGKNGTSSTNGGTKNGGSQTTWNQYIKTSSGGDGDTVTTDLGVQFKYSNKFGGHWAQNPYNPYSVSGKAQTWSPSLLEDWVWGTHIARGVNLGGWLVTEPFIVPGLYEQYQTSTPQAVDEYTLSQAMGKDLAAKMEEHYRTFITEEDFAAISAAGLNYVRIALGYWAVETVDGEPYLPKVSWTYFLKAIAWGRKYGIRIFLDFHALPGSQNGWNHSGKSGSVNWMYGVMGIANAQRSLETIRSITEYISQDGVKQVVPLFGLVNEVMSKTVGRDVLEKFYYQAYQTVRDITGYGTGNGPTLLMHEGFLGVAAWEKFLNGADRIGLDQHPYLAFGDINTAGHADQAKTPCTWGGGTNDSMTNFGLTVGGEWSNAINDCGLWLNGVGSTPKYSVAGNNCDQYDEWMNWSADFKQGVMSYAMANMDALQNWFFWTWKIGNSTVKGYPTSPQWHYRLGWEQGWMPKDPRAAGGHCKQLGIGGNQFEGTYPASATGSFANGTPTIAADQLASHTIWPPTTLGPSFGADQVPLLPTLTQTGSLNILPTASHPSNATNIGSGWANTNDQKGAWVKVNGCDYPDEYDAVNASVPTGVCTGSGKKRSEQHLAARLVLPTATAV